MFKLHKIPSEPLVDTAPDSFGHLIGAPYGFSFAAAFVEQFFLSCFPKTSCKSVASGPVSSHRIQTCVRACGVSQQSTEGNCDGVRVWGLKSATISPSLVTPGTKTFLLPFSISSCRRVPFRLLSLPIYYVVVLEQRRE